MSRALHPLAVKAIEEWIETLPEEARKDPWFAYWRCFTDGSETDISGRLGGLGGSVEQLTEYVRWSGIPPRGDYFDRPGPALIRSLRHAALQDIAAHWPPSLVEIDIVAERRYVSGTEYFRSNGFARHEATRYLQRRRLAAQRLLIMDDAAEARETAPDEAVAGYLRRIDAALGAGR
jgi:hypothetical protein